MNRACRCAFRLMWEPASGSRRPSRTERRPSHRPTPKDPPEARHAVRGQRPTSQETPFRCRQRWSARSGADAAVKPSNRSHAEKRCGCSDLTAHGKHDVGVAAEQFSDGKRARSRYIPRRILRSSRPNRNASAPGSSKIIAFPAQPGAKRLLAKGVVTLSAGQHGTAPRTFCSFSPEGADVGTRRPSRAELMILNYPRLHVCPGVSGTRPSRRMRPLTCNDRTPP